MKSEAVVHGKRMSTKAVLARQPTPLTIPLRELDADEVLVLGFRMNMLTMGDIGAVDTGTGVGTDFIVLKWGDRRALVRGSELLKAYVETVAPKDAKRFPKEVKSVKAHPK